MANLTISKYPNAVNPVGNPILVDITTSNYWSNTGTKSKIEIQFDNSGTGFSGKTIIIAFGSLEVTMTCVSATPDQSGTQFYYNNGTMTEAEWVATVVTAFQKNWLLSKYYDISVKTGDSDCMVLQAKTADSEYNITLSGTALSGALITQLSNTSAVTKLANYFYRIHMLLNITGYTIPELAATVDESTLKAYFDLAEVLPQLFDEFFNFYLHDGSRIVQLFSSEAYIKEFNFDYSEAYGLDVLRNKLKLTSSTYNLIPVKLTEEELASTDGSIYNGVYFNNKLLSTNPYINSATKFKTISKNSFLYGKEIAYFFNYYGITQIQALFKFILADGTEKIAYATSRINVSDKDLILIAFPEWDTVYCQDDWDDAVYVTLTLYSNSGTICTQKYSIDHNTYLFENFIYVKNSFGVYETVRLTGEKKVTKNLEKETIELDESGYIYSRNFDQLQSEALQIDSGFDYNQEQLHYIIGLLFNADMLFITSEDNDFYLANITGKKLDYIEKVNRTENGFVLSLEKYYVPESLLDDWFASSSRITLYLLTILIRDSYTLTGVPNATITINYLTLTTDDNGYAYINLREASYSYTVTADNYEDYSGTKTMPASASSLTVSLIKKYQILFAVYSVSLSIEQPLKNATISIEGRNLITNDVGQAEIYLSNDTYSYRVNALGYEEYNGSVTVNNANAYVQVIMTEKDKP